MTPRFPIELQGKDTEISKPYPGLSDTRTSILDSGVSQELRFRDIVRILLKHSRLILLCLGAGFVVAIVVSIMMPPLYSGTATVEVDKSAGSSISFNDQSHSDDTGASGMDLAADLLTEKSVLENDSTALTVIKKLDLRSKPPFVFDPKQLESNSSVLSKAWAATVRFVQHPKDTAAAKAQEDAMNGELIQESGLPLDQAPFVRVRDLAIFRKHLQVRLIKGTRLIEIHYTDPNPVQAAAVANAVVDAYLSNYRQTRYDATANASTWLASQLVDLKDKVQDSQEKVVDFERDNGLVGSTALSAGEGATGGEGNNVELNRLVDLNKDLTTAQVDRISKEAVYRVTQTEDPSAVLGLGGTELARAGGESSVISPGSNDIALLQQLRQQRAALSIQYASAATTYGSKNPVLLQLQNQLSAIDKQITGEMDRIRKLAKNDYELSRISEDNVRASVAAQEEKVGKLNTGTAQLEVLEQQARSNRALYEDLYSKLEEAKVAAGVRASYSNTNIVDPGRIPYMPSSPNIPLNLAIGLVLGLFCGCAASLLIEYFNDSVESAEEIELLTGAPLLGIVPAFTVNRIASVPGENSNLAKREAKFREGAGWLQNAPSSVTAEAYRTLRTSLLMSKAEGPPKTVLFTSPAGGDGKSTTCMNTAVALAHQGNRVLLIDADMRRPSIDRLTNMEQSIGLSNLLTSQMDVSSLIQVHRDVANLWLLPSGDPTPVPAELLGSNRFRDVLQQLEEKFDFVFIDSPPLLLVTDALLIATQVQGVILVVRSGSTTRSALRDTARLLRTVRVALLGNVLNGANRKSSGYRYKTVEDDNSTRSARYAS